MPFFESWILELAAMSEIINIAVSSCQLLHCMTAHMMITIHQLKLEKGPETGITPSGKVSQKVGIDSMITRNLNISD